MPNVVWVDFDKLKLDEGAAVQIFDLSVDSEAEGDVSSRFQPTEPLEFQRAAVAIDKKWFH